jgi:DNA-binding MarR family transcriptional regulator
MSSRERSSLAAPTSNIVEACRALYGAIDALDQTAADRLDITRNDLRCLNLLETGPATPGRISSALELTSGAVTALVDRLERKGLVERSRDPDDRRGVRVGATPAVYRALGPVYRTYAEALTALAAGYGQDERAAACRHLLDAARVCRETVEAVRSGEAAM